MLGKKITVMPIPHIHEHTEYVKAGALTIGVEYRVLNDQISNAYLSTVRPGTTRTERPGIADGGVSIHVFAEEQGKLVEYLRFDAFDKEPHYHYIYPAERTQVRVILDPAAEGDLMQWILGRLRHRIPQMLESEGAAELARRADAQAIAAAMPQVERAVQRALSGGRPMKVATA